MLTRSEVQAIRKWQRQFKDRVCSRDVGSEKIESECGRMEVYQYAYRARLEESLAEDFSEFAKEVGEAKLSRVIQHFVTTTPSWSHTLAEYSLGFHPFLVKNRRQFRLSERSLFLAQKDLEKNRLFYAPELQRPQPLLGDEISLRYRQTALCLNPVSKKLSFGPHQVLIWRKHSEITDRRLTPEESEFLDLIGKKKSLIALERLLGRTKLSSSKVQKLTSRLVAEGILYLSTPTRKGSTP